MYMHRDTNLSMRFVNLNLNKLKKKGYISYKMLFFLGRVEEVIYYPQTF